MSTPRQTNERREVRDAVEALELRAAPADSKSPGTMVGYAAVYDRYSEDLGYFREKIAPGAFDKALARCDVRALFNHDTGCLLGRMSAGTLRCATDEIGLRVEIDLPDTTVGRDVAESIRRRDLMGQSFSFTTAVDQWDFSGATPLRTLLEVDELYDVGPVTFPAYGDTSAAMRGFEIEKQRRAEPDPAAIAAAAAQAAALAATREQDSARLRLAEIS